MGRYSGKIIVEWHRTLFTMVNSFLDVIIKSNFPSYMYALLWIDGAGFIAMYATLASRDVDCCLIPESPFYLEGPGGLFEFAEKRLKENGHMVIVIAEGAGQELVSESIQSLQKQDASGNKLLQDVGLWISSKIKVWIVIYAEYLKCDFRLHYISS